MRAVEAVADIVGIVDLELFIEQIGRFRAWDAKRRDADVAD